MHWFTVKFNIYLQVIVLGNGRGEMPVPEDFLERVNSMKEKNHQHKKELTTAEGMYLWDACPDRARTLIKHVAAAAAIGSWTQYKDSIFIGRK